MRRHGLLCGCALLLAAASLARAQDNKPSTVPGSPPGFNFPMSMEAVQAAPINHHPIYEDDHVRLLEVTLWPGDREQMHGHARPSVFATDAVQPKMNNDHLAEGGPPNFGQSISPPGAPPYPTCMTMGPQSPHAATVTDPYPQHFYRLEFKRLDGDNGLAEHWRDWYPDTTRRPAKTSRTNRPPQPTAGWPYPASLDESRAAPNNYKVLLANDHIRLVEVMIRPGETEPMHGSPYWAVEAYDAPEMGAPGGPGFVLHEQKGPLASSRPRQRAEKPATWNFPTCDTEGPTAPHQITNTGSVPIHYYRVEFLRVDGPGFAAHWKTWYPDMAKGPHIAGR